MARVIPPDFALEARDCLSLFDAFREQARQGGIQEKDIAGLDPVVFFPSDDFIKQKDVLRYEQALKMILSKLIDMPHSHDTSSALQGVVRHVIDPVVAKTKESLLTIASKRKELEDDLIHLVSDLHVNDDLCETQAQRLLSCLQNAEEQWRKTSSKWQRKIKDWEQYQAKVKERERAKERSQRQRQDEDHVSDTVSWEAQFDPSDPSPEFSFAGMRTSYNWSALYSDLKDLAWTSTPDWALQAIKRGIAVHHAGMNRRYRNLIEALFRIGFIRVMIATTLALGINAPCRTVIFCGDSTYLTALQYRQAAGRAGRRGFDLVGKVVFYGITLDRVQRLVLSRLPPISGQFPLSTTLCLRLFNLLAGSQNAEYAVKAVSRILSLPQISVGSEAGQHELLHHLCFNIDYLLRAHLLSPDGHLLNLAGTAIHLYYHEPNNLAFVALLQGGVIHKICNQPSKDAAMRELMLVLCHIFGQRRLPRSALNTETLRPLVKRYPSMVVLPPLPQAACDILLDHRALTLRVFTGYARTYASQYASKLGSDDVLPLSGVCITTSSTCETVFLSKLRLTASSFVARSAFVATSGHTDSFASARELCREARQALYLNENAIPSMDAILADDSSPFKLNAYLLDFYVHGQPGALVHANGIRRGDLWFLLQDFVLTLKTIETSIQELLVKVSKQHIAVQDSNSDSGYVDLDTGDELDLDDVGDDDFHRPPGVDDNDWEVYKTISELAQDFDSKFHKMWA